MTWARADFNWNNIEATEGEPDWETHDTLVENATANNVNVLALITYAPTWANGGQNYQYPPTDLADFATFAASVVARYAPQGVTHYEIWNEPNSATFWKPLVDGAGYANLLRAAYIAMKAVDPTITVLLCGMALSTTTQDSGTNVSPNIFLQRVYDTIGSGYFDAVNYHPYGWPRTTLAAVRQVMVDNGDIAKKVWLTEYGMATNGTEGQNFVSELEQERTLRRVIREARAIDYVEALIFYEFTDSVNAQPGSEGYFGLIRSDASNKPAWVAVRDTIERG